MNITELLGLDDLLAQLVVALGAAMIIGNGAALFMHYRGKRPVRAETEFRQARAWWLLGVGVLIAFWGIVSLIVA